MIQRLDAMRILYRLILIIIFPFFFASTTVAKPESSSYKIGGVAVDMTEKQVVAEWGKPLKRSKVSAACFDGFVLSYQRGQVSLREKDKNYFATSITTQSIKLKTERGVKVGDDISKAKKLYPTLTSQVISKNDSNWYVINPNRSLVSFQFKTNKHKIVSIQLDENSGC
jgi:hypothetical protein